MPWRRKWQPSPEFLPGESRGQRNLAGYSPWGCKESDMTEVTEHKHRTLSPEHLRDLDLGLFNLGKFLLKKIVHSVKFWYVES